MANKEILWWRKKIDRLDKKLAVLLEKRTEYAIEIGKIKHKENIEVYDPTREDEVIRNVQQVAGPNLSKAAIRRLFERIIDETRRTERELREREE